jgi:hypothetical protein
MIPTAGRAGSSSAAAVIMVAAVLVPSSLHLPAGARVDLSRHDDHDIAGACALAVTPLGYPCEEHQVRFLYRVGYSSHSDRRIRCTVNQTCETYRSSRLCMGRMDRKFCAWRHAIPFDRPGLLTYWLCAGDDGGRVHLELATDPAEPPRRRRRACGAAGDPAAWGPSGKHCMHGHDASNLFFPIASRFHVLCSACTRPDVVAGASWLSFRVAPFFLFMCSRAFLAGKLFPFLNRKALSVKGFRVRVSVWSKI